MKNTHIYKRLFSYVLQYRAKLWILIFLSFLSVTFDIIKPIPVKLLIDNVISNQPLPKPLLNFFITHEIFLDKQYLLVLCIILLVIVVIGSAFLSFIVFNYTINLAQRLVYELSIDFYHKLQRLSLSFYLKNQIGDLLERMNGDIYVVYFLVAQIVIPVFTSVVCLSGMFYVMAQIDLLLAVIAALVVPLLGITLAFFAKPMNDTTMVQYNKHGQLSAFVQQSLISMKVIQAFGQESFMHDKFKLHAETFSHAFKKANKVSMTFNQLSQLITGLATAAVMGFGTYRVLNGLISTGDLFIFIGYITALYGPVNSLSIAIGTLVTLGSRGRRIFDIIDSDEVIHEKADAQSIILPKGGVEFRNVSFGYGMNEKNNTPVLKNISFNILPGQVVAVVGPTGAGKTSLISLLTRFYDPWEGKIFLDGIDVSDLQLHSLRKSISLVLQDSVLFPMTIRENIAFANPEASFKDIVEASKMAQAHDFIMELPKGYDTMLSENGASLSGGQRQRIAIARAFLKDAPILILDEPTSAVDALTESKIFKALTHFSRGKTVFLISHRLSTIKNADIIITIKDGEVVELGNHESLMSNDKLYASMYNHQP